MTQARSSTSRNVFGFRRVLPVRDGFRADTGQCVPRNLNCPIPATLGVARMISVSFFTGVPMNLGDLVVFEDYGGMRPPFGYYAAVHFSFRVKTRCPQSIQKVGTSKRLPLKQFHSNGFVGFLLVSLLGPMTKPSSTEVSVTSLIGVVAKLSVSAYPELSKSYLHMFS